MRRKSDDKNSQKTILSMDNLRFYKINNKYKIQSK